MQFPGELYFRLCRKNRWFCCAILVTGYSYQDAAAILAEYGLKYEVTPELTSDEKKDKSFTFEVVDQYPKAGSKIDKDEKVYLYRE